MLWQTFSLRVSHTHLWFGNSHTFLTQVNWNKHFSLILSSMLITIELLNGEIWGKRVGRNCCVEILNREEFSALKIRIRNIAFLPRIEHQQLVFILIQNRNTLNNRRCYFMQEVCRHFFPILFLLKLICLVIGVGTFNSLFIFTVPLFSGKSGSCQTNEKSSWTWQQISTGEIETSFFLR